MPRFAQASACVAPRQGSPFLRTLQMMFWVSGRGLIGARKKPSATRVRISEAVHQSDLWYCCLLSAGQIDMPSYMRLLVGPRAGKSHAETLRIKSWSL